MSSSCKSWQVSLGLLGCLLCACATSTVSRQGAPPPSQSAAQQELREFRSARVELADAEKENELRQLLRDLNARGIELRVQVKVFNRRALLVGETISPAVREHLEIDAARSWHIRKVYNLISVARTLPAYNNLADVALRTQVSFILAGLRDLDDERIEFLVDRGRIFLLGIVTAREGELIVASLRGINGVREILVAFDYAET